MTVSQTYLSISVNACHLVKQKLDFGKTLAKQTLMVKLA